MSVRVTGNDDAARRAMRHRLRSRRALEHSSIERTVIPREDILRGHRPNGSACSIDDYDQTPIEAAARLKAGANKPALAKAREYIAAGLPVDKIVKQLPICWYCPAARTDVSDPLSV